MTTALARFAGHKYLNLETFRKLRRLAAVSEPDGEREPAAEILTLSLAKGKDP